MRSEATGGAVRCASASSRRLQTSWTALAAPSGCAPPVPRSSPPPRPGTFPSAQMLNPPRGSLPVISTAPSGSSRSSAVWANRMERSSCLTGSVARMKRMLAELGSEPRAARRSAPVPVAALLEDVAQSRAAPALNIEPADPQLAIMADRDLLTTAIGHLAQNAIEAVRGIGRVTLRSTPRDDRVIIEVEDDGPGMSAAFVRDELFRPLTTTKATGYGIGAMQD